MVRVLLALLLSVAPFCGAETPSDLSATAQAQAPLEQFQPEPNSPAEDFFTVSLISLPFTALWSFVGATTVAAVAQQKFPPEYNDSLLIGAGATAVGLSLGIGLFSVSWGEGSAPAKPLTPFTTDIK